MSPFIFVLMPFSKTLDDRYELAIAPAAQEAGMRVDRVDKQFFHQKGITERINQQIEEADLLIADVSRNNPNVLYEVGYAHAKGKLCILLTDNTKNIPFDLKDKRHVVFSNNRDLKQKLRNELEALKAELDITFDENDDQCDTTVAVSTFVTTRTGQSQARSIRVKVKHGSELPLKNVSAQMIKVERRLKGGRWKRFMLQQPIPLT
jgi:hypothetical protein